MKPARRAANRKRQESPLRDRAAAALFAWHAADDFPSYRVTREETGSGRRRLAPFDQQSEHTRALFREGASEVLRALGFRQAAGGDS